MKPFELTDTEGDFSVTLGPGVVKNFSIEAFLEANIDDVVSKLNSMPGKFLLKIPGYDLSLESPSRQSAIKTGAASAWMRTMDV